MHAEQSAPTSAGPRTPLPELPEQVGQLQQRRGADDRRRQQEREAGRVLVLTARPAGRRPSSRPSGRSRGSGPSACDVADDRLPCASATRRDALVAARASSSGRPGARRRSRSAPSSITPLTIRKNAALAGRRTGRAARARPAGRCSPTGIVPDDEQPAEAGVGVVAGISRARSERASPRTIRIQSAPEEPEQDERRRQVGRHEEGEEEVVVLVDVPAEQPRQDHAVPERRDRERLLTPWSRPEDRGLAVADHRRERPTAPAGGGAGREPGVRERREPEERTRRSPCLTWWWPCSEPADVAGEESGAASGPARASTRTRWPGAGCPRRRRAGRWRGSGAHRSSRGTRRLTTT